MEKFDNPAIFQEKAKSPEMRGNVKEMSERLAALYKGISNCRKIKGALLEKDPAQEGIFKGLDDLEQRANDELFEFSGRVAALQQEIDEVILENSFKNKNI